VEYSRQLAQFAAQLKYTDLPEAVITKAKEIALHGWGVQLAGSTLPWAKAVYRYVRDQGGTPQSTVLRFGLKTSMVQAAFANGTFGHGFEMDDNHSATSTKGGCVIVPAALAAAEHQLSSGKEFIVATVIGFEVLTRIARSVMPHVYQHHPTGACAPFGAALAVGRLFGFNETLMLHALGIAGSHSSGLQESPPSGRGNIKRIFGGLAASSGVRSALLAREGITGPATILEGDRGFCRAFGDDSKLQMLTAGLGSDWEILKVHYKVFAQDGYIQPMSEALTRLVREHGFGPDDVEEIIAGTNAHAHGHVIGRIREPDDLTSAQFSANFSLALLLVKGGADFFTYTDENLLDPQVKALSQRIRTEIDEEIDQEWHKTRPRGARIRVRLKSGKTLTEYVHNLREMSPGDVDAKVMRLAAVALDEKACERLVQTGRRFEDVRDVGSFARTLVSRDTTDA